MTILITGATGLLGGHLVAEAARRGIDAVACGGPARAASGLDLEDPLAVSALLARVRPEAVIHTAALSAMADCARDPDRARAINVDGAANVARGAAAVGARVVHVSTDLVFGGEEAPYDESSPTAPTSVYGATKRAAEDAVLAFGGVVVVRVSLLFGPGLTERSGFFDHQLETLRSGKPLTLFDDEWRTPLSLRFAAEALVALAGSDVEGLLHLGGPERMSRYEMGVRLADAVGCSAAGIARASRTSIGGEPRPRDVSLDSRLFHRRVPGLVAGSFEAECTRMLPGSEL